MTERYTLPASDAPAEEWGRVAVSLPGRPACWDDLEGVDGHDAPGAVCADGTWWSPDSADGMFLDVDHPATEGCLRRLLGDKAKDVQMIARPDLTLSWAFWNGTGWTFTSTLGRACIAAAAALGRWPGGE